MLDHGQILGQPVRVDQQNRGAGVMPGNGPPGVPQHTNLLYNKLNSQQGTPNQLPDRNNVNNNNPYWAHMSLTSAPPVNAIHTFSNQDKISDRGKNFSHS